MNSPDPPFKFGTLQDEVPVPYRYPDVYDDWPTTVGSRWAIGPSSRHIDLMIELSRELPEPFGMLYVLMVPRRGVRPAGRYQSPVPLERAVMESFLRQFEAFFENDGRHHVWITSLPRHDTLVYDNHNVIYAYGPLDGYEAVLRRRSLTRGRLQFPVPHTHHYHAQFDAAEEEVMARWEWKRFDLAPEDEP